MDEVIEKSRQETIHDKGFDLFNFNYTGADYRYDREIILLPCLEVAEGEDYIVEIDLGGLKDVQSVKHEGVEITNYTFDVNGKLTFNTNSFSPFVITYKEIKASGIEVSEENDTKIVAGEFEDTSVINKVEEFNDAYRLKEKGAILNRFDITEHEGYFSINDKISEIMGTLKGKLFLLGLGKELMGQMKGKAGGGGMTDMMPAGDGLMQMLGGFSILRLSSLMSMAGLTFTKEQLLDINAKLNKIKKK